MLHDSSWTPATFLALCKILVDKGIVDKDEIRKQILKYRKELYRKPMEAIGEIVFRDLGIELDSEP